MKRILIGLFLGFITAGAFAQWSNPGDDVPAYNSQPPAAKLPPILSGNELKGPSFRYPWQTTVYKMAAKVPAVLHQLPCYCRCDRSLGHNSLHSCFENTHGAECSTCAREAVYAYRLTKLGKTPREIREGVEHKQYESIDLDTLSSQL